MSELIFTEIATPATPPSGTTYIYVDSTTHVLTSKDDAAVVTQLMPTNPPAATFSSPADPTSTTNTTGVMMGLAGAITPVASGNVKITITGTINNNTIGDGASVQIRTGTGSAPANGAALTGTARGVMQNFVADTAAGKVGFMLVAYITGLTLNTAIWIDASLKAVTGGTAAIYDIDIVAAELT